MLRRNVGGERGEEEGSFSRFEDILSKTGRSQESISPEKAQSKPFPGFLIVKKGLISQKITQIWLIVDQTNLFYAVTPN